ncbi:MAG: hypothetical protein DRR16_07730 [Candidatus Parabeggiatoa sp. nov. 3]|nr:MAG: hypothetical protein DRR00_16685 [Gammaproteobacteria bacterium]RKZ87237.1 MAG: hypothetical protein DRR16_07730 [Gammaproteobacteria bacterium]
MTQEFRSSVIFNNPLGQLGQLKLPFAWHDFQSPLHKILYFRVHNEPKSELPLTSIKHIAL